MCLLLATEKTKNFKLTPWTCSEIFVRSSHDSPCSGSWKLTVRVANSPKAHSKLTVSVILWIHCEVTECPQNELSVSFNVSSQRDSCELKFFTGPTWIYKNLYLSSHYILKHLALWIILLQSAMFQLSKKPTKFQFAKKPTEWRAICLLNNWSD